jgi:hypothetical protein
MHKNKENEVYVLRFLLSDLMTQPSARLSLTRSAEPKYTAVAARPHRRRILQQLCTRSPPFKRLKRFKFKFKCGHDSNANAHTKEVGSHKSTHART